MTKHKTKILCPTITDIDAINTLMHYSKAYWGYEPAFMDRFMEKFGITENYLKNNMTQLFYLEDDLAGFYSFSRDAQGNYELDNFFLHPDYIGQGLGRILWEYCVDTAKQCNISSFTLWSDPFAENFYLKMGCIKIGTRQSPMLPNRFPAVMQFTL